MELLYFAWVREAVGTGRETIEAPDDLGTIADLLDWLAAHDERHAAAFADRERLRAAIDQRLVGLDAAIAGAREIAIFPPVTGG